MSAHATPDPPRRGRRPRTYAAVLEATSGLLATTSLADLSVAQILDAADVGRTSFYEHFASKDDVVVKLMESLSDEVVRELEPMFDRGERSPDDAFRLGLTNLIDAASRYAPLVVAVSEEWPAIPQLRAIWFRHARRLHRAPGAADRARAGRGDGTARAPTRRRWRRRWCGPPSAPSTWPRPASTRRCAMQRALVEPLVQLFVGTIYGRAVPQA